MKALIPTRRLTPERVFLVGVELKSAPANAIAAVDSLKELAELASTAGGLIVGEGRQKLESPVAATYIGTGKADEFARYCKSHEVDTVIFDDDLTPAQSRNLERILECKILDRTSLILDIFAQRARTREGKLQVELAQLQHLLPRLTRYWSHLSRQKGGIGMRGGEGETQLETDRRRVQERIDRIESELELVRRQRDTQRRGRKRAGWPLASIVGYTNAGKSTLLNTLTGACSLAEDKLFATLDPTTRRLHLPTNQNVLLSDTVGFIRKLPHQLVEAFKATLDEVIEADLLIHVVDISHPEAEAQMAAVETVLRELGADEKPTIIVFNKIDRLTERLELNRHLELHPGAIAICAADGSGIPEMLVELGAALRPTRQFVELAIPHEEPAAIARLHAVGQVFHRNYRGKTAHFKARIPPNCMAEFEKFVVSKQGEA